MVPCALPDIHGFVAAKRKVFSHALALLVDLRGVKLSPRTTQRVGPCTSFALVGMHDLNPQRNIT